VVPAYLFLVAKMAVVWRLGSFSLRAQPRGTPLPSRKNRSRKDKGAFDEPPLALTHSPDSTLVATQGSGEILHRLLDRITIESVPL
jgi:hypothetical protein